MWENTNKAVKHNKRYYMFLLEHKQFENFIFKTKIMHFVVLDYFGEIED